MEQSSLADTARYGMYTAGIVTTVVICVSLAFSKIYHKPRLPKGPGYIELAKMFFALAKGTPMHELVRDFSKVYGDVLTLTLGQTAIVMVSSKDGLREGMLTKGLDFADRPNLYAANLNYGGDRNNGIFISDYDTKCKQKRKLFLSALRLRGDTQLVLEQKILQETLNVIQRFKQQPKDGFDPKEIIMCSVMNVTFHILFNKHYTPDDGEFLTIMHNVDTRFRAYITLLYLDLFPILRLLPHKNHKTIENCNNWLLELVQRFIDEHRTTLDETHPRDVVDKVLIEQKEDPEGQRLSDIDLQWSFVNVITAGFDTTGLTTLWGLALLAKNPKVQSKLQSELKASFHEDEHIRWQDRKRCPYLEATILEIQRCSNISTYAPNKTRKNTSIQGQNIPEGVNVFFCLWSYHFDPRYWDRPMDFDPTRFLNSAGEVYQQEAVMTFGLGPRLCPGENLARMELLMFFGNIFKSLNVTFAANSTSFDFAPAKNSLPLSPKPFDICVS